MRLRIVLAALAALVPTSAAAVDVRTGLCDPENVAVFTNRVHVECTAPIQGTNISFLAQSTAERDHANRLLTTFLTAQALGTQLFVRFDLDDMSGAAFGCLVNDCRVPDWVQVESPGAVLQGPVAASLVATTFLLPEPAGRLPETAGLIALGMLKVVPRSRIGWPGRPSRHAT